MSATYQQARLSRDPRFDGKFFVAVKTTHIFCRSICPAKLPLEKNVEYYELAESAILSGYRPCLRCRPDSAPDSFAWQGIDTTLNRAIKLLKQYPELSINEITTKLGVSPRYLRQLFQHKLGMSPKQFQLFNKVLFAKRLLHESQISVEKVAMASGFSSSRRLQSQFKKITGLTPSNIRKVKSVSMPNQNINLKLNYRPPYHWEHIKDFLFLRAIKGIETITDNSYSRTFVIEQEPGWFKMTFNPKHTYFDLEIKLNNLSHLRSVIMNIERLFDLKADPVAIHNQLLATGLAKEHLVKGLRLPGIWNCFEAGCRAILGQQISVKSAISLLTKLSENLAEKHQTLSYFPSSSAVANSNLEFLKIPNSRKQTLIDFASYMQNNEKNPLNHSIDDLISIKGIGPWTVSYVKLRGQSSPDIWLDSDLIIKKQLAQYKISPQKAEPWRSYLTLQLWNLA